MSRAPGHFDLPRQVGAEISADWGEVWARFLDTPRTLGPSPGVREDWHRGRRRFAVWLLPVTDRAVLARVAEVQAALGGFIRPLPPEQLHVTAWVAGFPARIPTEEDDVDEAALAELGRGLRARPPVAPRLQVGPASAFLSCAMLEVRDEHGELEALRTRLLRGPPEVRFAPFRPHITLGRFPADLDTREIVSRLAPYRSLPSLLLRARELRRVELDAFVEDGPHRAVLSIPLPDRAVDRG